MKKVIFTLIFVMCISKSAYACECKPLDVKEKFSRANDVFIGEVRSINHIENDSEYVENWGPKEVEFAVLEILKGAGKNSMTIRTKRSSAACGYHFKEFEKYLVYTSLNADDNNRTWVGLCGGTKPLDSAQENLAEIEKINAVTLEE